MGAPGTTILGDTEVNELLCLKNRSSAELLRVARENIGYSLRSAEETFLVLPQPGKTFFRKMESVLKNPVHYGY
jgi:hypothetical protein